MCWHKDIAKFQILMKTILSQSLDIQYERMGANLHSLCIFNGNLIDFIMALLSKIFKISEFYVLTF